MEASMSESWDDLSIEQHVNNQEQAEQLVGILDQAKIGRFQLQVAFEAEYQRLQFENQWKLQIEGEDESGRTVKQRFKTFQKKPENLPNEYIMELGQEFIRSKIFVHMFRQELDRMETQNGYRIFADRTKLRIFMKEGCELNMLTKNKLSEMKDQLNVHYSWDQGIIFKVSKSKKLLNQLEKYGITAWFSMYRGRQTGYFFSNKLLIKQIVKIVNEVAKFDMSIFSLRSKQLNYLENQSLFWLIKQSLASEVANLQQQYEVDVQFNENHQCLVVHKLHACFGGEVENYLHKMLDNLVLISVRGLNIRDFNKGIRKEIKKMPFLKERMKGSRSETFLAINIAQLTQNGKINTKYLQSFLKYFKLIVDHELNIKVFFHHIQRDKVIEQIDRVKLLAQENHLIMKNQNELSEKYGAKGLWYMKGISEAVLAKRQRQLISFVKGVIVKVESNPKQIQEIVDSFFDDNNNTEMSRSLTKQDMMSEQKSRSEEKGRLQWLNDDFKMPKMREIQEEDKAYILGSRKRQLQKLFEANTRAKFKIWNVELNSKVAWPTQVEQVPIFVCNAFNGRLFNEKCTPFNPSTLPFKQTGLIVHMDKNLSLKFVPVLHLERID